MDDFSVPGMSFRLLQVLRSYYSKYIFNALLFEDEGKSYLGKSFIKYPNKMSKN